MKRIITAALLLSFSFAFAFITNHIITDKMNGISEKLKILIGASSSVSSEELSKMTEEIINEWENSEWIVHAFINTDSVIETEQSLKMLDELANEGLTDEFATHCIDAYSRVNSLCSSEKINKENIF